MDALDAIEQISDHLKSGDGGAFGSHLVLDVFTVSLLFNCWNGHSSGD